jgi:hypothetical protein
MKLHFDNEWLKQRIGEDDEEPGGLMAISPDQLAQTSRETPKRKKASYVGVSAIFELRLAYTLKHGGVQPSPRMRRCPE